MKEKIAKSRHDIAELGLRSRKYLLFVGNLTKQEGAHLLIEAFKQLEDTAKTPNNFKLVIVANGKDDDQDYVKYLNFISQKRDNIIFFCVRKKSAIKLLIENAYLFVQVSLAVLQKDVLLDAMKNGLAPMVSSEKEFVSIVGENGFLFTAGSVLDLRDRLAYLLSRSEEVALMGMRAKKRAQQLTKEIAKLKRIEEKREEIISVKHTKFVWNWKNLLKKCH